MTEQRKIILLYIAFSVTLALQVLPQLSLQLVALIALLGLCIVTRSIRKKSEKDSLSHNHATYLSRTLWFWGLLLAAGTVVICIWLIQTYDTARLNMLLQSLLQGDYYSLQMIGLYVLAFIGLAPSFIYLIWRIVRGFRHILKNTFIPNPKALL